MSNGKALIAGVLGLVALLAIVAGTFTVTSKAEPAEADCFEISCLVDFLTMDPCETETLGAAQFDLCELCPESSCFTEILGILENCDLSGETPIQNLCCEEPNGETPAAALIDLCCEEVELDGVNAAVIDPCELCLDPSCISEILNSIPEPCEAAEGTPLGSLCCEVEEPEGPTGPTGPTGVGAALIDFCCEEDQNGDFNSALVDPCALCLEPSCITEILNSIPELCSLTEGTPIGSLCCDTEEIIQAAALTLCCDSEIPNDTGAALVEVCCESESTPEANAALIDLCCEMDENGGGGGAALLSLGCGCEEPPVAPPSASLIDSDMLSQLFSQGILLLLGRDPCPPIEEEL